DANGKHIAATRDFDRWDGTLFDDPEKTESRIPKGYTPYPKGAHIDDPKPSQKPPRCIPKGHIDSAPVCIPKGHITVGHSLSSPSALQGGREARDIPELLLRRSMLDTVRCRLSCVSWRLACR